MLTTTKPVCVSLSALVGCVDEPHIPHKSFGFVAQITWPAPSLVLPSPVSRPLMSNTHPTPIQHSLCRAWISCAGGRCCSRREEQPTQAPPRLASPGRVWRLPCNTDEHTQHKPQHQHGSRHDDLPGPAPTLVESDGKCFLRGGRSEHGGPQPARRGQWRGG